LLTYFVFGCKSTALIRWLLKSNNNLSTYFDYQNVYVAYSVLTKRQVLIFEASGRSRSIRVCFFWRWIQWY